MSSNSLSIARCAALKPCVCVTAACFAAIHTLLVGVRCETGPLASLVRRVVGTTCICVIEFVRTFSCFCVLGGRERHKTRQVTTISTNVQGRTHTPNPERTYRICTPHERTLTTFIGSMCVAKVLGWDFAVANAVSVNCHSWPPQLTQHQR